MKYTVIKAFNNKIEQGENNVLFYVCVCSYLAGKKSFITFTVNLQCPTRIEGIMVSQLYLKFPIALLNTNTMIICWRDLQKKKKKFRQLERFSFQLKI